MVTRIQTVQFKQQRIAKRKKGQNYFLIIAMILCAAVSLNLIANKSAEKLSLSGQIIRVYNVETDTLMELDLETYLVGVVAAEMPASFESEALKAQAVAARTFAQNRMQHTNSKVTALHPKAQITTSPETCQAWIDDAVQKERWGTAYETWREKIVQAVSQTKGEVLCYEGVLIEPVYHASCGGGLTEAAADVWGNARPYLISVACNHPVDKHSNEMITVSLQELTKQLNLPDTVTAGKMYGDTDYMQIVKRTASNRVKEVRIGTKTVRGGELRSALGLKSTLFDWEICGETIVFTTNGYGHGAGMCQHGANYYAEQGYHYRQILQHYYPGTELQTII